MKITAIVCDDGFAADFVVMPQLKELRLVTGDECQWWDKEVWVYFQDDLDSPSLVIDAARIVRIGYDSISRSRAVEEMRDNLAAKKGGLH